MSVKTGLGIILGTALGSFLGLGLLAIGAELSARRAYRKIAEGHEAVKERLREYAEPDEQRVCTREICLHYGEDVPDNHECSLPYHRCADFMCKHFGDRVDVTHEHGYPETGTPVRCTKKVCQYYGLDVTEHHLHYTAPILAETPETD